MSDDIIHIPDVVPIFPLNGVVLFPHTIVPLRIFEPRYRAMTADALSRDGVIAIAMLAPGWEPLYHTRAAPIYPVIGVGSIMEHQLLDNGNYHMLLRGVARARVLEEIDGALYRQARIALIETTRGSDEDARLRVRGLLFDAIRENTALDPELREQWMKLGEADIELDALADLIAAGVPADAELRQAMLAEPDGLGRAQILVQHLEAIMAIARNVRRPRGPGDASLN